MYGVAVIADVAVAVIFSFADRSHVTCANAMFTKVTSLLRRLYQSFLTYYVATSPPSLPLGTNDKKLRRHIVDKACLHCMLFGHARGTHPP